jgi:ATP-dependent Clp protease adaptor protein ClpS
MAEELKNEGSEGATRGVSGTAVRPRPAKKRAPKKTPPKPLPLWKVLLHNDDVNDIGYVIVTIVQLTPLDEQRAVKCTEEADKTGVALLLVTHKERAELYQDQFQSKGLTITIEPAD